MELALKEEAARQCFLMQSRKNKRRRLELLSFFEENKKEKDMENKKLKLAAPSCGAEEISMQANTMKNDSTKSKIDTAVDFSEMAAQYYEALSRGNGSLVHQVEEELQAIEDRPECRVKQEIDQESSSEGSKESEDSSDDEEDSADVKQELKSDPHSSGDETGESCGEDSSENEKNVDEPVDTGIKVEPNEEIFRFLYSRDSSSSEGEEPLVKSEVK